MLNLFLKNITSSINVENYLFERYQNIPFKNDYLRDYLINKNIISKTRNVYTVNFESFCVHSKHKKINLRYLSKNIGMLIISDYCLIYNFNNTINKLLKFDIFDFLRKEFLRFMFNKKIVIFTLFQKPHLMNDIFNHFDLKSKYEKSLRKLLNFERRKNALLWCESIKNLNNALGWVFNNLHLKIEIIKFL